MIHVLRMRAQPASTFEREAARSLRVRHCDSTAAMQTQQRSSGTHHARRQSHARQSARRHGRRGRCNRLTAPAAATPAADRAASAPRAAESERGQGKNCTDGRARFLGRRFCRLDGQALIACRMQLEHRRISLSRLDQSGGEINSCQSAAAPRRESKARKDPPPSASPPSSSLSGRGLRSR